MIIIIKNHWLAIAFRYFCEIGMHPSNVIHKDINPSNIVLNPNTGLVKIIDFGISSQLTHIPHPQLSHKLHWLVAVNNSRNG
jgi:serine/threonine protein kinase